MSRRLNIALLLLVVIPLLTLAAIGTVTVAFVARVGTEETYEFAFRALNHTLAVEKTEGLSDSRQSDEIASQKGHKSAPQQPRKKLYPEAVKAYRPEPQDSVAEECLEVIDDPDRLLECIRKATPSGDTLKNGNVEGLSARDTATLFLLDPTSSAAMKIRDGDSHIDYVTVKLSNRRTNTRPSAKIRFQKLSGPRFLVLHGPSNTNWLLDNSIPKGLTGVLILTRENEPTGSVFGVPEGIPIWRYAFAKNAIRFPFVSGIIPKCQERENGSVDCVNGPKSGIHSKKKRKTPFQIVDDWSRETLGQPLSTLSSTSASSSALVVVPKETITQATRDSIKRELQRAKLLLAEGKLKAERRRDYEKRWYVEQHQLATADFTERPHFDPEKAAEKAESIVIASIYETLTKERRKGRNSQLYDSYAEYKERADSDVRPVSVSVSLDKPTILVLTSHAPVKWVFDIEKPEMITAVQIEGLQVPSISGLPTTIPVRVKSFALADKSAAHFLHPKDEDDTPKALDRLGQEFSRLPIKLISNYRADAIKISD